MWPGGKYKALKLGVFPDINEMWWGWWARQDSNLRQRRYERRVLTAELRARFLLPAVRAGIKGETAPPIARPCVQTDKKPSLNRKGPVGPAD